ncbi:MAG: aspartate--tRNA ligase [Verrucomicrobia bacterium]|nr:MAG: aspartate--tRNA ligase [Verrucomicrobiota bacterium]
MSYRTCTCGALRVTHLNSQPTLCGWVNSRRDHGGVIFVDLRDSDGITQIVFHPETNSELAELAHTLRSEDVIQVTGRVACRLSGTENPKLATGEIEVVVTSLNILNRSEVLPFPLDSEVSNEDLRLSYRYLDLRSPMMTRNLRIRHRLQRAIRTYMDQQGFMEVETPILSKSTPEGAREFLVPSRTYPGNFYALAQSPQQYKQLLMAGGVEKYFQIARCFRDEDPRADRLIELTQLDVEASFFKSEDIFILIEGLISRIFQETLEINVPSRFPCLTYREAMERFGSDKPDTRFGMELIQVEDIFQSTDFKVFRTALDHGGCIKALNAKGFAHITTGQIEELTQLARRHHAKGLAFIKVENGEWKSPIVKFFTPAEKEALAARLNIEEGDLILFGADKWAVVCEVLGRIRLRVAELLKLVTDATRLDFLWVVDFPLLSFLEEEGKWGAVHHPFTRPKAEDLPLLKEGKFDEIRAEAYDLVLNGVEIGGGSIRIHEQKLQAQIFEVLGIKPEKQQLLFGHLLDAFRFGTPPHGGIALGVDRLMMLLCGTANIRDVIAFPKSSRGQDLLFLSPSEVEARQLHELSIQLTPKS